MCGCCVTWLRSILTGQFPRVWRSLRSDTPFWCADRAQLWRRIKYQLPEMNVYIARNPGPAHQNDAIVAGVATHNESGFIQVHL